jgi:hypothetical protein
MMSLRINCFVLFMLIVLITGCSKSNNSIVNPSVVPSIGVGNKITNNEEDQTLINGLIICACWIINKHFQRT